MAAGTSTRCEGVRYCDVQTVRPVVARRFRLPDIMPAWRVALDGLDQTLGHAFALRAAEYLYMALFSFAGIRF